MTKKLTLSIEQSAIEKAKLYAKGTQRSLSEMVQNYFESLDRTKVEGKISPKIQEILDMIPKDMPQYTDEELDDFRREYLEKKYM